MSPNLKNPSETNPSNIASFRFNVTLPMRCHWSGYQNQKHGSKEAPIIQRAERKDFMVSARYEDNVRTDPRWFPPRGKYCLALVGCPCPALSSGSLDGHLAPLPFSVELSRSRQFSFAFPSFSSSAFLFFGNTLNCFA